MEWKAKHLHFFFQAQQEESEDEDDDVLQDLLNLKEPADEKQAKSQIQLFSQSRFISNDAAKEEDEEEEESDENVKRK